MVAEAFGEILEAKEPYLKEYDLHALTAVRVHQVRCQAESLLTGITNSLVNKL